MSVFREAGTETAGCPLLPGVDADLTICQPCRFFRGASAVFRPDGTSQKRICCNWPRDGSYTAPDLREPIPDLFLDAFGLTAVEEES